MRQSASGVSPEAPAAADEAAAERNRSETVEATEAAEAAAAAAAAEWVEERSALYARAAALEEEAHAARLELKSAQYANQQLVNELEMSRANERQLRELLEDTLRSGALDAKGGSSTSNSTTSTPGLAAFKRSPALDRAAAAPAAAASLTQSPLTEVRHASSPLAGRAEAAPPSPGEVEAVAEEMRGWALTAGGGALDESPSPLAGRRAKTEPQGASEVAAARPRSLTTLRWCSIPRWSTRP